LDHERLSGRRRNKPKLGRLSDNSEDSSRAKGEAIVGGILKFFGSVVGIIFLIGLLVVIGLLALIF
jgi:hypothetical protein